MQLQPLLSEQALLKDWPAERDRFQKDPDAFWAEMARQFAWTKPWDKVFEWDGIHHKWFMGARTNITVNALDRHAKSENANRVRFIWLGEDGSERIVTYRPALPRCLPLRQRAEVAGREEGRSGRHLHAADASKARSRCWPARASARSTPWFMPGWDIRRCAIAWKMRRPRSSLSATRASAAASRFR